MEEMNWEVKNLYHVLPSTYHPSHNEYELTQALEDSVIQIRFKYKIWKVQHLI